MPRLADRVKPRLVALRVPVGLIDAAYGGIRAFGLINSVTDPAAGQTHIWITKQWFQLLLDELRNRGRRI